jgi:Chaperone of endosialidase
MKTKTSSIIHSINRLPWRSGFLRIAFALVWIALSQPAQAVDPPPDGGYPGQNTAEGEDALFSLTVGTENTAIGFHALYSNTTGGNNTATGKDALANNTIGSTNTANGSLALFSNTGGSGNTAIGYLALLFNTGGYSNTAVGGEALRDNTVGALNTAIGYAALGQNTTGSANTATGLLALSGNTTADNNTATGDSALYSTTTGNDNTASGSQALYSNTTGNFNTATGGLALRNNVTGRQNTATGYRALGRNEIGRSNIALGFEAGLNLTTGSNNIDIGNTGLQGESNTIRIGMVGIQTATFIAGISGATVPTGVAVIVDSSGHLGTTTSSARIKDAIEPMEKASETIFALKPVTFRYKKEFDPDGIRQFGLVAEDVEKVSPDLVARDDDGKPYTVRYEAVNAMLLNEFLKEHRKVEQLEKQVAALTAGLQKMSAHVEMSKPELQSVANISNERK